MTVCAVPARATRLPRGATNAAGRRRTRLQPRLAKIPSRGDRPLHTCAFSPPALGQQPRPRPVRAGRVPEGPRAGGTRLCFGSRDLAARGPRPDCGPPKASLLAAHGATGRPLRRERRPNPRSAVRQQTAVGTLLRGATKSASESPTSGDVPSDTMWHRTSARIRRSPLLPTSVGTTEISHRAAGRTARRSGRETKGAASGLVLLRPNGALPDVGWGSTLVRLLPYTKRGNHARRPVVRHVIGNARGTPCLIAGAASSTKEGS
jgi:hypothetical protein